MTNTDRLNLLTGIRNRLITKGWRQGNVDFAGKYRKACLLDTIDIVSQDLNISYQDTTEVEDLIRYFVLYTKDGQKYSHDGGVFMVSLIEWNNYKHRKLKHVLEVLDTAISLILSEINGEN